MFTHSERDKTRVWTPCKEITRYYLELYLSLWLTDFPDADNSISGDIYLGEFLVYAPRHPGRTGDCFIGVTKRDKVGPIHADVVTVTAYGYHCG